MYSTGQNYKNKLFFVYSLFFLSLHRRYSDVIYAQLQTSTFSFIIYLIEVQMSHNQYRGKFLRKNSKFLHGQNYKNTETFKDFLQKIFSYYFWERDESVQKNASYSLINKVSKNSKVLAQKWSYNVHRVEALKNVSKISEKLNSFKRKLNSDSLKSIS